MEVGNRTVSFQREFYLGMSKVLHDETALTTQPEAVFI